MDIWAWVEDFSEQLAKQGQQRLAYDLLHLPSLVVDNRHDEVDRLVPSLLAAARDMEHRWLEVYIRHWNLQSRVLKRYEVRGLLPEAIDLLDFANRDDTKSCPQSICVVQDLANCYADTDGPAYGQERLDVAAETLARIDPSWPCFRCISGEYASALLDLDRPREALDFCHRQLAAIGPTGNPYDFRDSKVEALIALGKLEEALAFNTDAENPGGGDSWLVHKTIDQARLLTRLERHEEAKAILPAFDAVADTPAYFTDWADAMKHLVDASAAPNDWELDLQLRVMALRLEDNGALRDAWRLQRLRTELALARSRPWVARHAVEAMRRITAELERPLDAEALTDEIDQTVAAAEREATVEVRETPDANLEASGEPDVDYERLRRALDRWPDDERLWLGWSRAAGVLGRASEIIERGRAFADEQPEAWQVAIVVGQTMVALGEVDAAEVWADTVFQRVDSSESRASARFVQALAAERRGELDAMQARLEEVIEHDPHARNSRTMLADLARNRGEYDVALEHLDVLVEIEPNVGSHHWGRIVAATMEDQWDVVRSSAKALGLELGSDSGPVEEEWGPCKVQLRDDTGTAFELFAVRTGPVTARIMEISAPELQPQYFDAKVVFDPRPVNPPPPDAKPAADGGNAEPPVLIFPLLDVLNASTFHAFAVDGVRPTDVQIDALISDLKPAEAVVQVRSGSDYQIHHETQGDREAAYWYLAVREDAALTTVAARLDKLGEEVDGPLVWPELARSAGREDLLDDQQAMISAWDLM